MATMHKDKQMNNNDKTTILKNLHLIADILKDSYNYIIIPKALMNVPVEFSTMELVEVDEDGNETNIGYGCMNDLVNAIGDLFKPEELYNGYIAYRWCYNIGVNEQDVFKNYLESKGLVNMQSKYGEFNFDIPNGYAMCDIRTYRSIPRPSSDESNI
jgi:hypothetical protein